MIQRNDLRAWFAPGLTLLVPVVAVLTVVPMVRVYEIHLVELGFSPEEYARPHTAEEEATVDLYRQARDSFLLHLQEPDDETKEVNEQEQREKERAWVGANRETLRLTLAATRQRNCNFYSHPLDCDPVIVHLQNLRELLELDADLLESEGNLGGALDRRLAVLRMIRHLRQRSGFDWPTEERERSALDGILQWAKHADQTPDGIGLAIKQLEELMRQMPPVSEQYKADYLVHRRLVEGDEDVLQAMFNDPETVEDIITIARWAPWEQARALRLLDQRAHQDVTALVWLEAEAGRSMHPREYCFAGPNDRRIQNTWSVALNRLDLNAADGMARQYVEIVARRRTTLVLLAIEAWRLEHGRLPDKLEDLVGPYFDQLPVDPYSGVGFLWFPEGYGTPIAGGRQSPALDAGRPFLWSAGPDVHRFRSDIDSFDFFVQDAGGGWRRPTCTYEALKSGRLFPVDP